MAGLSGRKRSSRSPEIPEGFREGRDVNGFGWIDDAEVAAIDRNIRRDLRRKGKLARGYRSFVVSESQLKRSMPKDADVAINPVYQYWRRTASKGPKPWGGPEDKNPAVRTRNCAGIVYLEPVFGRSNPSSREAQRLLIRHVPLVPTPGRFALPTNALALSCGRHAGWRKAAGAEARRSGGEQT